jgi:uncharacterized membrane protein
MSSTPPAIGSLISELLADIQARFVDYFLGGLGVGLVVLIASVAGVFLLYGGMFGGMFLGLSLGDEDLMFIGMMAGMSGGIFLMVGLLLLVTAPLHASLGRAMDRHLAGEETLDLKAPFSSWNQNLAGVYTFVAIHTLIGLFLTLLCYLPGIIWYAVTDFAWCWVVLDGDGPMEAIQKAIRHFQENLVWHLLYVAVLFVVFMLMSYLPLVGPFLAPSMTMAWRIYAFRRSVRGADALAKA